MKPRDLADYLFLALAWGFSFLFVRIVSHVFGWVGAVSLRALVAMAAVWLMAKATRRPLNFNAGWWPFAVVGATAGAVVGAAFAAAVGATGAAGGASPPQAASRAEPAAPMPPKASLPNQARLVVPGLAP